MLRHAYAEALEVLDLLSLWAPSLLATALTIWLIRWANRPYNYLKDLTDIGYWHVRGLKSTHRSKRVEEDRIRRTRRAGDRLPPPFPNGWYMVTESEKLRPGQAISVDIIGQNFVVFRTEAGEPAIFDAYCPHLGANLGVGGTVKGDCIECPFHEWQFRASDGECTVIPYSPATVARSVAKLKKWPCSEVNGAVFVWYHAEAEAAVEPQPEWQLPAVPQIDSGKWLYNGKNEFVVNGHIQQMPENAADVGHLNSIHSPNLLTGSDLRFMRPWWNRFATHTWSLTYAPSTETETKHVAYLDLKHSLRVLNWFDVMTMTVTVQQVGPAYVMLHLSSLLGEFQILQTVVPVEPLMQRVVHRFYFPRGRGLFAKFVIWGESIMFERDTMVWNHQRFNDKPLLMKEERTIRIFRNWYSQFYTEHSKTFEQLRDAAMQW